MRNKKGRKYYVWMGSYAALIVLSILVNLIGYFVSVRIVREELLKNNSAALEQVQSSCDNYLTDMKNTARAIYSSDAVVGRLLFPEILSERDLQDTVHRSSAQIRRYVESFKVIRGAQLLVKNRELCIGTEGARTMEEAFAQDYSAYYTSEAEWKAELFNADQGRFKLLEQEGRPHRLLYLQSSRSEHPDYGGVVQNPDYKAAVILEVNYNLLNEKLNEYQDSRQNDFYIISNPDVVAFGTAAEEELSLRRDGGGLHVGSRDRGRTLVSCQSNITDVTYICSIANDAYMGRLHLVTAAFVASYLLCALLCGALALWFSRRNYREQVVMENQLSDRDERLRETTLAQILTGRMKWNGGRLLAMLANDLPLVGNAFAVVLFDLPAVEDGARTVRLDAQREAIVTIFIRLVRESATVQHCSINGTEVCVLCFFEERGASYVTEKIKAVHTFLNKDIPFIAAVSSFAQDVSQLPVLYEQAVDVMGYEFLEKDRFVFAYDEEVPAAGRWQYDKETEKKLSQLLALGDGEGTLDCIRAFVQRLRAEAKVPVSLLRIVLMELMGTLLRQAAQFGEEDVPDYRPLYDAVMQLTYVRQLDGVLEQMCAYAQELCAQMAHNKDMFARQRSQSVKEYVRKNFADNNLNVNIIADQFGITPSYMSRCFKEETGETLTDYIVRCRIEKAKEYLRSFDRNISQIAADVGFGSSAVFIRAFKRYEGITPTQFRSYFTGGAEE